MKAIRSILLPLILAGCAAGPGPAVKDNAEAPAVGAIDPSRLQSDYPLFAAQAPSADELAAVKSALGDESNVRLKVFLGTWCSDSQREVPKLLGLLQQLPSGRLPAEFVALDRGKSDPGGLASDWRIERIPTVIVLRDGQEIGRIVEHPQQSLALDLAEILRQVSSAGFE